MKYTQSEKIRKYVFPNEKARRFLCNDFYQEILEVVPPSRCISPFNQIKRVRLKNLALVKRVVTTFVNANEDYQKQLKEIYLCDNVDRIIINRLIIGFVYFLAMTTKEFNDINITTSERSICFYDLDMMKMLSE